MHPDPLRDDRAGVPQNRGFAACHPGDPNQPPLAVGEQVFRPEARYIHTVVHLHDGYPLPVLALAGRGVEIRLRHSDGVVDIAVLDRAERAIRQACAVCHQPTGRGAARHRVDIFERVRGIGEPEAVQPLRAAADHVAVSDVDHPIAAGDFNEVGSVVDRRISALAGESGRRVNLGDRAVVRGPRGIGLPHDVARVPLTITVADQQQVAALVVVDVVEVPNAQIARASRLIDGVVLPYDLPRVAAIGAALD